MATAKKSAAGAKKAAAKKSSAKKAAPAKKAAAKKAAPAKKAAAKAPAKKAAAKAPAKKAAAPAKKAAATKGAAPKKRALNPALAAPMQPSADLAAVIGNKPMPRSEVAKSIWAYIHKNGLQDQVNKRNINADDSLKKVFGGKKQVSMFEMTALVNKHLTKA
ncbi:SWIB/MDM2 domain-containing protein [Roseisolibacter sp. H3M3-2]|uniref:SWIB/MDM2 domain-containing protein n=1 Tax=Roseisolibacter sp. H3M3-2 TaxID=3031323 RepID=UPI0023DC826E|nr:SWIB/MDM2 domain-containing protein [Roseisolibacter sp. H3M3-2]MDF1503612.1 SWIB/MDM2 domain-containing protein [Roseisolibacter sp. H3M3-2]